MEASTEFKPSFLIKHPLVQSILGTRCPSDCTPSDSDIVLVDTLDQSGDQLAVLSGTANNLEKKHVLLVPGLGSSAKALNIQRLAAKLEQTGWHVFRMNHRGSGEGEGKAKQIYHSGRSQDVIACLHYFTQTYVQDQVITVVSSSMGANLTLKAFGENHSSEHKIVSNRVVLHIAISPVINLLESSKGMSKLYGGFIEKYFKKSIEKYCVRRHKIFADLGPFQMPRPFSIYAFDSAYTAPAAGYSSAEEYYAASTAKSVMGNTSVDTVLIYSQDDFLEPLKDFPLNNKITAIKTRHGGHMGFVSSVFGKRRKYWLDECVADILEQYVSA